MNKKIIIITFIALFIDLLSKYLAYKYIQTPIVIIPNFFQLNYAINTGAAWSILTNHTYLLNIVSVIILVLIFRYSKSFKNNLFNPLTNK